MKAIRCLPPGGPNTPYNAAAHTCMRQKQVAVSSKSELLYGWYFAMANTDAFGNHRHYIDVSTGSSFRRGLTVSWCMEMDQCVTLQ